MYSVPYWIICKQNMHIHAHVRIANTFMDRAYLALWLTLELWMEI